MIFNKKAFMAYMEENFNGFENPFMRRLIDNVVEYGEKEKTHSKDQLVYFLSDIIPEVEFGEIAQFADNSYLTKTGLMQKQDWLQEHSSSEYQELANTHKANNNVLAAVDGAMCLYGSDEIIVRHNDYYSMIDIEIIEVGEWMNGVEETANCDIEALKKELDRRGVAYEL